MNAQQFVETLAEVRLSNVFNPYVDKCALHDLEDGPAKRCKNLVGYLQTIERLGADTVWMGRDLGYRGGRRTGLALTDERHLPDVAKIYPGTGTNQATKGPVVAERTAAEIWALLGLLIEPPMLWNVFPFHPYEVGNDLSNRKFSAKELGSVEELNYELFKWLRIKRVICIGRDAAQYASRFGVNVGSVRHPSYGGVKDFRVGIARLYPTMRREAGRFQASLFGES